MRAIALTALLTLSLTACISPREPEVPPMTLDGNGIAVSETAQRIDFGRDQAGVIGTVSRLLGDDPEGITTQQECGAGPVTAARWEDGLTLNFQNGTFSGWTSSDPGIPVEFGFVAGMPRTAMPDASFQVSTLGEEFTRARIGGLLSQDASTVALLWSGTTCFFR